MGKVLIGYIPEPCLNCNRVRIEKYTDGTLICEKCLYDQNMKEFISQEDYDEKILGYLMEENHD